MSRVACFTKIKGTELESKFAEVSEFMPEAQQRELGIKLALEYYKQLHDELQDIKRAVSADPKTYVPDEFVSPDKSKEIKAVTDKFNEDLAAAKTAAEAKPAKPKVRVSVGTPPVSVLSQIGQAFSKRFGIKHEVITPERAKEILDGIDSKNVFFQILDDVDVFDSRDPATAKAFISKVFNTVADAAEAQKAYRKLAVKYHPDKQGSEEIMKFLNDANDRYKKGKAQATQSRSARPGPQTTKAYDDFYEDLFGKNSEYARYQQQANAREKARQQQSRPEDDAERAKKKAEAEIKQKEYQRVKADVAAAFSQAYKDKDDKHSANFKEKEQREKDARERREAAEKANREKYNAAEKQADVDYSDYRENKKQKDANWTAYRDAEKTISEQWSNDHKAATAAYSANYKEIEAEYDRKYKAGREREDRARNAAYGFQYNESGIPAGFYDPATKTAYLVEGVADETTPIHEIFSHPFIEALESENKPLYDRLLKEAKADSQVKEHVEDKYGKDAPEAEYIARAIDLEAKGQLKSKSLIDYIKEFWAAATSYVSEMFGGKDAAVKNLNGNTTFKDIVDFVTKSNEQLDLSAAPDKYPFAAEPNKKQAAILAEVFPGVEQIKLILGDVIDLYHFRQWRRVSRGEKGDQIMWTIGASKTQGNKFYMYEPSTGNIYLEGEMSTFPYTPTAEERAKYEPQETQAEKLAKAKKNLPPVEPAQPKPAKTEPAEDADKPKRTGAKLSDDQFLAATLPAYTEKQKNEFKATTVDTLIKAGQNVKKNIQGSNRNVPAAQIEKSLYDAPVTRALGGARPAIQDRLAKIWEDATGERDSEAMKRTAREFAERTGIDFVKGTKGEAVEVAAAPAEEETDSPKTKASHSPNKHGMYDSDDVQEIEFAKTTKGWKGLPYVSIKYVQLENGNWIATHGITTSNSGSYSPLSIYDKQFATKQEAILSEVNDAIDWLQHQGLKDQDFNKYIKWLNGVKKENGGTVVEVKNERPKDKNPANAATPAEQAEEETDSPKTKDGHSPNEHGVYIKGVQTLEMPRAKSFKGSAEINFVHLENGNWIAANSVAGGTWGSTGPVSIHNTRYATKQEAILAEVDKIIDKLQGQGLKDKDFNKYISWLNGVKEENGGTVVEVKNERQKTNTKTHEEILQDLGVKPKTIAEIYNTPDAHLSELLEGMSDVFEPAYDRQHAIGEEMKGLDKKSQQFKDLAAENERIGDAIYSAQMDFADDLRQKVVDRATEMGIAATDDAAVADIVEALTDGRQMENIFNRYTVQQWTDRLIKDDLGPIEVKDVLLSEAEVIEELKYADEVDMQTLQDFPVDMIAKKVDGKIVYEVDTKDEKPVAQFSSYDEAEKYFNDELDKKDEAEDAENDLPPIAAENTILEEEQILAELKKHPDTTVMVTPLDFYIDFTADMKKGKVVYSLAWGYKDPVTFKSYKKAVAFFDDLIANWENQPELPDGDDQDHPTKEAKDIFPEPQNRRIINTEVKKTLPQTDADATVQGWKDHAKRIGQEEDHSNEVVISLFDASGAWSQPYKDAGYTVIRYDLSRGDDIMQENWPYVRQQIEASGKKIVGILSASPCTSFAGSGARWWGAQHDQPSKEWVEKKYGQFAAQYFDKPLDYGIALVDMVKIAVQELNPSLFHVNENPVGRIQEKAELPNPSLTFQPHNFGDPYTKKTMLWGTMNTNLPTANVEPADGSKAHQLSSGDADRSLTPEGFSYAFFMANNTSKLKFYGKQSEQGTQRDTEAIITSGEALINEAGTVTKEEEIDVTTDKIEKAIEEIESKVGKLKEVWSTKGVVADYPINIVRKEIKKEVAKYAKSIAKQLGWRISADDIRANIPPAGGEVTFRFTLPDVPGYLPQAITMYVQAKYEPDYTSGGGYDNYTFKGFMYRLEDVSAQGSKQYLSGSQFLRDNVTAAQMAAILKREAAKPDVFSNNLGKPRSAAAVLDAPAKQPLSDLTKSRSALIPLPTKPAATPAPAAPDYGALYKQYYKEYKKLANGNPILQETYALRKLQEEHGLSKEDADFISQKWTPEDTSKKLPSQRVPGTPAFDFDNPLAEIEQDGITYRITDATSAGGKKTYTVYKDKEKVGTYGTVAEAQAAIKPAAADTPFKVGDILTYEDGKEAKILFQNPKNKIWTVEYTMAPADEKTGETAYYTQFRTTEELQADGATVRKPVEIAVSQTGSLHTPEVKQRIATNTIDNELTYLPLSIAEMEKEYPNPPSYVGATIAAKKKRLASLRTAAGRKAAEQELIALIDDSAPLAFEGDVLVFPDGREGTLNRIQVKNGKAIWDIQFPTVSGATNVEHMTPAEAVRAGVTLKPNSPNGEKAVATPQPPAMVPPIKQNNTTYNFAHLDTKGNKLYIASEGLNAKYPYLIINAFGSSNSKVTLDDEFPELQQYAKSFPPGNVGFYTIPPITKPTTAAAPKQRFTKKISDEAKKELDDLWDDFADLSGKLGLTANPEDEIKKHVMALKIVARATKYGVYKLVDIIAMGFDKLGSAVFDPLVPYVKKAYLAFQSEATEAQLAEMDSITEVRKFDYEQFKAEGDGQHDNADTPDTAGAATDGMAGNQSAGGVKGTKQNGQAAGAPGSTGTVGQSDNQTADEKGQKQGGSRGGSEGTDSTSGAADQSNEDAGQGIASDQGKIGRLKPIPTNPADQNHIIEPDDVIVPDGNPAKVTANMNAILLLRQLEAENRNATPEEKKTLAKFVGWGQLASYLKDFENDTEEKILKRIFEGTSQRIGSYNTIEAGEKLDVAGKSFEQIVKEVQSRYAQIVQENPNVERYINNNTLPLDLARSYALPFLMDAQEHAAAVNSTINAHYTDRTIISPIWDLVKKLGFTGGNVLESSAGIGHFFGLMSKELQDNSNLTGVELDKLTGRMLKKLYPDANIQVKGFEATNFPNNSFDLAISNVPFAKTALLTDPKNPDIDKFNMHNYFIAKNLKQLKPGGIAVMITSKSTMDNATSARARRWFLSPEGGNSELIGAVRLPNNAFDKNAGTQVTTDIMVFQKRKDKVVRNIHPFAATQNVRSEMIQGQLASIDLNEYYIDHPEHMLGQMKFAFEVGSGGLYGRLDPTLHAEPGTDIPAKVAEVFNEFPTNILDTDKSTNTTESVATNHKVGKMFSLDGKVYISNGDQGEEPAFSKPEHTKVALAYLPVRDAIREHVKMEMNTDATDTEIEKSRAELNKLYDAFVKKHGTINKNDFLYDHDIEYSIAAASENVKEETIHNITGGKPKNITTVTKGAIYSGRVNFPRKEPSTAANLPDAIHISVAYRNQVDPEFIGQLMGISAEQATNDLLDQKLVFKNPTSGLLETPDDYLSGNVRLKFQQAHDAAQLDPDYSRNEIELEKVQPEDKPISQIPFKMGVSWIPANMYMDFIKEKLGVDVKIQYLDKAGIWGMDTAHMTGERDSNNTSTYAVADHTGLDIIQDIMANRTTVVTDPVDGGGRVKNEVNTLAAGDMQAKIVDEFRHWIAGHEYHGATIENVYNQTFNNLVEKTFKEPPFKYFPGQSTAVFQFRMHQYKAVQRGITGDPLLLAHGVGTGKTAIQQTIAMEWRRLKTSKKPMIVVQNSTLKDFANKFQKLYPGANLLVSSEADKGEAERRRFFARVQQGDWDAIIIPQSQFDRIPDNPDRVAAYLQERIDEMKTVLGGQGIDGFVKSRMEREIEDLEEQISAAYMSKEELADIKAAANNMYVDENTGEVVQGKPPKSKKGGKQKIKKDAEKILKLTARLQKQAARRTDNVMYFEDMGIDGLIVDEAHLYKKLGFQTGMQNIRGIDTGWSQMALGLKLKVGAVKEKTGGKNIVFATGTPITNTMAEAWTMMRFLQPELIEQMGIQYFDQFASTFTNVVPSLEQNAGGRFEVVERMKEFINAKQLQAIFRRMADVVFAEDIPEFKSDPDNAPPKLAGGGFEMVLVPQSKALAGVLQRLTNHYDWWKELGGKEKRELSYLPLVLYGIAKKASIDLRLVDPRAVDDPDSKVNYTVRNALKIYNEYGKYKGTQMIFSDAIQSGNAENVRNILGVPDGLKPFNLYADIKRKLIAGGVPASEIIVMSDLKKDSEKLAMQDKMNSGAVRFVIGGTAKMGIGINAHMRMIGLHHIDAPDRPDQFTQRNGRIIRPGNMFTKLGIPVHVMTYGTEDTRDATSYGRLRDKEGFVTSFMQGKGDDTIEDTGEEDETQSAGDFFSHMSAKLSGSKYASELIFAQKDLRSESNRYEAFRQKRRESEYKLSNKISGRESILNTVKSVEQDLEEKNAAFPDNKITTLTVKGKETTEKIHEVLDLLIKEAQTDHDAEQKRLDDEAKAAGLKTSKSAKPAKRKFKLNGIEGTISSSLYGGDPLEIVDMPGIGLVSRAFNGGLGLLSVVRNHIKDLDDAPQRWRDFLKKEEANIETLKKNLTETYDHEKLKDLEDRVDRLKALVLQESADKEAKDKAAVAAEKAAAEKERKAQERIAKGLPPEEELAPENPAEPGRPTDLPAIIGLQHPEVRTDIPIIKKELGFTPMQSFLYDQLNNVSIENFEDAVINMTAKAEDEVDKIAGEISDVEEAAADDESSSVQELIDIYEEGKNYTIDDLVNDVDSIAAELGNDDLTAAIEQYREEQGGNTDTAETNILAAITKAAAEQKLQAAQSQLEGDKKLKALRVQLKDATAILDDLKLAESGYREVTFEEITALVAKVKARLQSRINVKEGTDLFPADANIAEIHFVTQSNFDDLSRRTGIEAGALLKDFYNWIKGAAVKFSHLVGEYAKITAVALALFTASFNVNAQSPVADRAVTPQEQVQVQGTGILQKIYKQYPGLKALGEVTIKADENFTKEKTGTGSIEYFSPTQDTIRYGNGYKVAHPKLGTHGILYNPRTNNAQSIMLDMLHGMAAASPEYAAERERLKKVLVKEFQDDIDAEWNALDADRSDGKEKFTDNWIDGVIRNLMFEGTPAQFKAARYWDKARQTYLKNPEAKDAFNQLRNQIIGNDARSVITRMVEKYYSVNDEIAPQETIDRALFLWEAFGKPEIFADSTRRNERAYALNQTPIILANITDIDEFIAELSHAAQFVSKAYLDDKEYKTQAAYDKYEYKRKGSTEYDAHQLIEPMIGEFIFTGRKGEELLRDLPQDLADQSRDAIIKYKLTPIVDGTIQFSAKNDVEEFETNDKRPATVQLLQAAYPGVVVVQSQNELPAEVQQEAAERKIKVEGVVYNGQVYMVADNLANMGRAEGVFRHETIGHIGVIRAIDKGLHQLATSLVDNATGVQRAALENLAARNGKVLEQLTPAEKIELGSEYIAMAAERPERYPGTMQQIISFIRDLLRKMGFHLSVSDKDIKVLLARAQNFAAVQMAAGDNAIYFSAQDDYMKHMEEMRRKAQEGTKEPEPNLKSTDEYTDDFIKYVRAKNKKAGKGEPTSADVIAELEKEKGTAAEVRRGDKAFTEDEAEGIYNYVKQKFGDKPPAQPPPPKGKKKPAAADDGDGKIDDLSTGIPGEAEVRQYISGETIEKYTGERPKNSQDYFYVALDSAFQRGVDIIQTAKDVYGDDYVVRLLDFLKTHKKTVEATALIYVSLRNDLYNRKAIESENFAEISKLQTLVHIDSQAYAHDISRGMNMWKLQNLAKYHYDGSTVTDPLFTAAELETKADVEDAVQANEDEVNKEYEEQFFADEPDEEEQEQERKDAEAEETEKTEEKPDERKKSKPEESKTMAANKEKLKDRTQKLMDDIKKLNCK